ncbi:hypothetical protein ACFX2J_005641 [Malus domestica]
MTAPRRMPKSSGNLLAFFIERLASTAISTQIGFANVGTIELGLGLLLVAPDTNFPREMLALIASRRGTTCRASDAPLYDASLGFECFLLSQVLLNSTKLLVPPGEPSSSRIMSSANSVVGI